MRERREDEDEEEEEEEKEKEEAVIAKTTSCVPMLLAINDLNFQLYWIRFAVVQVGLGNG